MKRWLSLMLAVALMLALLPMRSHAQGVVNGPAECGACWFFDVTESDWFYDGVDYVARHALMNGTDTDNFSPKHAMTRAMVVTVLFRLSAEQAPDAAQIYSDVPVGKWYDKAVRWGTAKGIVAGYPDGTFRPDQTISREQLVSLFYRYAAEQGKDVSARASLDGFRDSGYIRSYARDAFAWALQEQLVQGTGNQMLSPHATANRAQNAVLLQRLCCWLVGEPVPQPATSTPEAEAAMSPGWNYRGGSWYYCQNDGSLLRSRAYLNGFWHRFDAEGKWLGAEATDLRSVVNAQPLNPQRTGVADLDRLVDQVFAQLFAPGDTTYDKLLKIHKYIKSSITYSQPSWKLEEQLIAASGNLVYRSYLDTYIAADAYDTLKTHIGVCDNYAAVFVVLTRALGLESYRHGGQISGTGHMWTTVRLSNHLYFFDSRAECYANTTTRYFGLYDTPSYYTYASKNYELAHEFGFEPAKPLTLTIWYWDVEGCHKQTRTFEMSEARSQLGVLEVMDVLGALVDHGVPMRYVIEAKGTGACCIEHASEAGRYNFENNGRVGGYFLNKSDSYAYDLFMCVTEFDSGRCICYEVSVHDVWD